MAARPSAFHAGNLVHRNVTKEKSQIVFGLEKICIGGIPGASVIEAPA